MKRYVLSVHQAEFPQGKIIFLCIKAAHKSAIGARALEKAMNCLMLPFIYFCSFCTFMLYIPKVLNFFSHPRIGAMSPRPALPVAPARESGHCTTSAPDEPGCAKAFPGGREGIPGWEGGPGIQPLDLIQRLITRLHSLLVSVPVQIQGAHRES